MLKKLLFLLFLSFVPACTVGAYGGTYASGPYGPSVEYVVVTYADGSCWWFDGAWYPLCPRAFGQAGYHYWYGGGWYVYPGYDWPYRPGEPPPRIRVTVPPPRRYHVPPPRVRDHRSPPPRVRDHRTRPRR
jgi:hypothetical protein